jgi:uncharacterized protein YjbJ (UPF0337 family)
MGKKDKDTHAVHATKGSNKEDTGKSAGNDTIEADGMVDEMKGNLKHTDEKVQDAFKE